MILGKKSKAKVQTLQAAADKALPQYLAEAEEDRRNYREALRRAEQAEARAEGLQTRITDLQAQLDAARKQVETASRIIQRQRETITELSDKVDYLDHRQPGRDPEEEPPRDPITGRYAGGSKPEKMKVAFYSDLLHCSRSEMAAALDISLDSLDTYRRKFAALKPKGERGQELPAIRDFFKGDSPESWGTATVKEYDYTEGQWTDRPVTLPRDYWPPAQWLSLFPVFGQSEAS